MSPIRIALPGREFSRPENWREKLEDMMSFDKYRREKWSIMTPLEKDALTEEVKQQPEKHYGEIFQGIHGEYIQAIDNYQRAGENVQAQRRAEARRYTSDKLLSEMGLADALLKNGLKMQGSFGRDGRIPGLEAVYREWMDTGDLHKQRGICEVFRSGLREFVASGAPEAERRAANLLAQRADQDLVKVRTTPEIEQARAAHQEAAKSLLAKRAEMVEIGSFMDGAQVDNVLNANGYGKDCKRVRVRSGEVVVFKEDDPEVSGILIRDSKNETASAGG